MKPVSARTFGGASHALSMFLTLGAALVPAWGSQAQPLPRDAVPAPLSPWVDWALASSPQYGCTWLPNGELQCGWTGSLELELGASGATFAMRVFVERPDVAVPLVGDQRHWPTEVVVDGQPHPVTESTANLPTLVLAPGAHSIRGRFGWSEQPETLTLPSSVGRVVLRGPDGVVERPRIDFSARTIWLQTVQREAAEQDTLSVEVYRRVEDGASLRVVTRLVLHVSGRPREIDLGQVLLEGSLPIEVDSTIPLQLGDDQRVTVQAHPGRFELDLIAIVPSPEAALRPPSRAASVDWPEQEIWVWVADEALRQAELTGPALIDPERTNLPSTWRGLPTFLVTSESELDITTRRRGDPNPSPNQVHLRRELWLDPDGVGLTGRDSLSGQMHRDWRIEFLGGELGRARTNGQPHLISSIRGRPGIEIRSGAIDANAEWRDHDASSRFLAVGWSQDVQSLQTTLYLAPGWRLLAATGVDRVESSWLTSWTLWGLFFVLIVGVTLARLGGIVLGALALAAVTLCYHEPGAPFEIWIPLIAALALAKALPDGVFRSMFRLTYGFLFAVLTMIVIFFSGNELRRGLWPYSISTSYSTYDDMLGGLAEPMMEEYGASAAESGRWSSAPMQADGSEASDFVSRSRNLTAYEPNAVLQTGPGMPSWDARGGRRVALGWTGPVTSDAEVGLWLIPPWIGALLSILRVLLLGSLLYLLWRAWPPAPAARSSAAAQGAGTGAAVAIALGLLGGQGLSHARAQPNSSVDSWSPIPSTAMLEELRNRLSAAPACHPRCANIAEAEIAIDGARLRVDAMVDASATAAFAVPGPLQDWMPTSVLVDGVEADATARLSDGFLYVRVLPGVHQVRIEGALPSPDAFVLSQAMIAHQVRISVPDNWSVQGRRNGEQAGNSLQFQRRIESTDSNEPNQRGTRVQPWLELRREYELGIRWEVHTIVRRISAVGSPILARIPLLEGESVTSAEIAVEDGQVVLTLGGNETERRWDSVLQPREELILTANETAIGNEIWSFSPGTVWRCEFDGINPVRTVDENGYWNPLYRPFTGDQLTLRIQRLEAAEGRSVTIDSAHLELTPGNRLTAAVLTFTVRSSIGATHSVRLPEDATLTSIRVNGETRFAEQRERDVGFTLPPGENSIRLEYQEPRPLDFAYRGSDVTLSSDAVNIEVTIHRPDRWVLWLSGPAWGPSVLFWPYLLIVLLVSLVLARVLDSPLRVYDWVLLGLGISQLPWWMAWILPSWVALIVWREKQPGGLPNGVFDLRQLAIVFWTLVSALVLYGVVHLGLLVDPDTAVSPPSVGRLDWYLDRIGGEAPFALPRPTLYSLPVWTYHVAMLVWSIWLATRVVGWAQWAFSAFGSGGFWEMRNQVPPQAPTGHVPPHAPTGHVPPGQDQGPVVPTSLGTTPDQQPLSAPSDESPGRDT